MADYNVDFTPAKGEGTSPLAPVQEHTINAPNPWIGFAAGAASVLMQTMKDKKELEKQQLIDTTIASFTREQTSINDAVAQGSMSKAQGDARAKANFSKYAAAYPGLIAKLKESNVALVENTALSDMKAETQMFQEEYKRLRQGMIDAGYPIYEGMDPKLMKTFEDTFQFTRRKQAEFEAMAKVNSERRSQKAEDRAASDFADKEETARNLSQIGSKHGLATVDFIDQVVRTADTPEKKEVALSKLKGYFVTIENGIAATAGKFPEQAAIYRSMFADLKKFGEDAINGNVKANMLENQLKEFKDRLQITALAHPGIQAATALNLLMPQMVSTTKDSNRAAMDVMASFINNGGMHAPVVGNAAIESDIYDAFKKTVVKLQNGKFSNPQEAEKQLGNVGNNILDQINKALSNGLEGKDLVASAKLLASPEFAVMVEKGQINKDQAANAKTMLQYLLGENVTKQIEGKLEQPFTTGLLSPARGRTYGDQVEFKWVGDGIRLDKKMNNPMNLQEMGERDRFLNDLAPFTQSLNVLIKAGAHLAGTRDYASYWDENKHLILPQHFPELDGPGATHREPGSEKDKFIPASDLKAGMELGGFIYQGGSPDNPKSWKKK